VFKNDKREKDFTTIMAFVKPARKRGRSAFLAIKDALVNQPFSVSLALAAVVTL